MCFNMIRLLWCGHCQSFIYVLTIGWVSVKCLHIIRAEKEGESWWYLLIESRAFRISVSLTTFKLIKRNYKLENKSSIEKFSNQPILFKPNHCCSNPFQLLPIRGLSHANLHHSLLSISQQGKSIKANTLFVLIVKLWLQGVRWPREISRRTLCFLIYGIVPVGIYFCAFPWFPWPIQHLSNPGWSVKKAAVFRMSKKCGLDISTKIDSTVCL